MAVKHAQVTVGTSASSLTDAVDNVETRGESRSQVARSLLVQNPTGGVTVYLGGSTVTSSSYGYALAAGTEIALDLTPGDEPFAAVASGTQAVRVLHLGV